MPFINPSFQRMPERSKWFWRGVLILGTILNTWEWFHDAAIGRTFSAVTDAVFVVILLSVIVASFFGGGKRTTQGR